MPKVIFKKINKVCGISMDKLEMMWSAAEKSSKDVDKKYKYAVVMKVFKSMLPEQCLTKLGWSKTNRLMEAWSPILEEIKNNKHHYRMNMKIGSEVLIVQKHHQRTGELTKGIIMKFLTNKSRHSRGIKVMLETGEIGRVQKILKK